MICLNVVVVGLQFATFARPRRLLVHHAQPDDDKDGLLGLEAFAKDYEDLSTLVPEKPVVAPWLATALNRTALALNRTVLALNRTAAAWNRTLAEWNEPLNATVVREMREERENRTEVNRTAPRWFVAARNRTVIALDNALDNTVAALNRTAIALSQPDLFDPDILAIVRGTGFAEVQRPEWNETREEANRAAQKAFGLGRVDFENAPFLAQLLRGRGYDFVMKRSSDGFEGVFLLEDRVAFGLFKRELDYLVEYGIENENQFLFSGRRSLAMLTSTRFNIPAVNVLFNPFFDDPGFPLQLNDLFVERAIVRWKSLSKLKYLPLYVEIPRVEIDVDAALPRPKRTTVNRVRRDWEEIVGPSITGEPFTSYPPVEAAQYLVPEFVCYVRNCPTFLAGAPNASFRLTARNLDFVTVDSDGDINNLEKCFQSFNGKNPRPVLNSSDPFVILCKRLVAGDLVVEILPDASDPDPASIQRIIDLPRFCAIVTLGYDGNELAAVRLDTNLNLADLKLPNSLVTSTFAPPPWLGRRQDPLTINFNLGAGPGVDKVTIEDSQGFLRLAQAGFGRPEPPTGAPVKISDEDYLMGEESRFRSFTSSLFERETYRGLRNRRIFKDRIQTYVYKPFLAAIFFLWTLRII